MRTRRTAIAAALAVSCLLLSSAAAATKDRVQVGRPGQNATAGFPLGLYTSVTVLPKYRALGRFDGESRNWAGPQYRSTSGLGGRPSTIDWQVTFVRAGSAGAAARGSLTLAWQVAERPQVRVPHRVGTRVVGSIPAATLLTRGPGDNSAQFESALAFPLCRGLFATAKFSLLNPGSIHTGDPSDTFAVDGTPAQTWNHDRALEALAQVALEGHLPLGRVTARAAGRAVTGTVRDCRGDALAGIAVRLLSGRATVARAKATATGSYRLNAPGAGTYRVEVAQTVTGKGGSGTRHDARSAAVTVR
ncbi:MAG: carboxypeptidase regulatory-like domain-containing protein [Thermoleophilia bacterium]|nr:carboxypeptidase regulatory-like domain-containing protein [Thermoleophilia bacterium]